MGSWDELADRLERATGSDVGLDADLGAVTGLGAGDYTASAEKIRGMVAAILPGWRLHVGFDATGMFPYASLRNNGQRVEASGPTLPMAMLRAVAKAMTGRSAPPDA